MPVMPTMSAPLRSRRVGRGVNAAVEDVFSACGGSLQESFPELKRIRLGEVDVVDRRAGAFEIGRRTPPGVVDDLVRHYQHAGRDVGADAADRGNRYHAVGARILERPDVGAVVHLVRRDGVAVAVPREEHHFAPSDAAEGKRARRLAIRRAHDAALRHFHVAELRQAAAPDDRYQRHRYSFIARISGRLRQ
jgi:hypothetical protein